MTKILRYLLIALFIQLALLCDSFVTLAANSSKYGGIEFYGSSQISNKELRDIVSLKPTAGYEEIEKAANKISKTLLQKHIAAHVEVVEDSLRNFYIVVDVVEGAEAPINRGLSFPRHVQVTSEQPFLLLNEMGERLEKLSEEGRNFSEEYKQGVLYFSDEPCNRLVEKLLVAAPAMHKEILEVLNSDTNQKRRKQALDLLNWAQQPDYDCRAIIDAIDDSDMQVRASATKFINARLNMLPDDFPFETLVQALSRELHRHSYEDRKEALNCLSSVIRRQPGLTISIKEQDATVLQEMCAGSIIPEMKQKACELLKLSANPELIPRRTKSNSAADGF